MKSCKMGKVSASTGKETPHAITKAMEAALSGVLLAQLQKIGLCLPGAASNAAAPGEIIADYTRWFAESLHLLEQSGHLSGTPHGLLTVGTLPDSAQAWQHWDDCREQWLRDPGQAARVALLDRTLRALPEILTGRKQAQEIIFAGTSSDGVAGVYRDNANVDFYNERVADVVDAYLHERLATDAQAAPARIIELGAGTGGTSAVVLHRLAQTATQVGEYCYTDISRMFLADARKRFGSEHPYLACTIFDVEKPPQGQGITEGKYDLAIATNVLHATRDIRRTLRHVKAALRKGALVIINEIDDNGGLFTHLTFGLLKGWWLYDDAELRIPGGPALSPDSWQRVLEQEGFHSVFFAADHAPSPGQQVIVAESDGDYASEQIDRSAVAPKATRQVTHDAPSDALKDTLRVLLRDHLCTLLDVDQDDVSLTGPFADYGLDSISAGIFVQRINASLDTDLETTVVFDHSTIERLTGHIVAQHASAMLHHAQAGVEHAHESPASTRSAVDPVPASEFQPVAATPSHARGGIAIIGLSGRLPGSRNVDELWDHLLAGDDLVSAHSRWNAQGTMAGESEQRLAIAGGFIDGIDEFDPLFFNISGLEAVYMDPQQRLFLQEGWRALEDAGYAGDSDAEQERPWAIYAGSEASGEYARLFAEDAPAQAMWGNNGAALPARLSYFQDLHGPAVAINTACSSSLVAVHHACQALWLHDVDMALAGGVTVHPTPGGFVSLARAGMTSSRGRCRTFDADADGFVPAEAVVVFVLKREVDALRDGDTIRAVIVASGTNQDGATNGITAPSARSQESLQRRVYETFGVSPADIDMVEAHGTATELGDPIEFSALTRSFRRYTDATGYCAIGSIKSSMGHATAAAGCAGLLRIVLSLLHERIPSPLHFDTPNPRIAIADSPFHVNRSALSWPRGKRLDGRAARRMAALNSFGMSGTNVHKRRYRCSELRGVRRSWRFSRPARRRNCMSRWRNCWRISKRSPRLPLVISPTPCLSAAVTWRIALLACIATSPTWQARWKRGLRAAAHRKPGRAT
jgi:polyketide synthase PksN